MKACRENEEISRLSHTASSVVWEEEPRDILTVPSQRDASSVPPPPEGSRARRAWQMLPATGSGQLDYLATSQIPSLLSRTAATGPRAGDPAWPSVLEDFRARIESTRPSARAATARVMLSLVGSWEETGDPRFLQGVNFNRLPPLRPSEESYLPSRTALIRSESTKSKAITNSPRFRPAPPEMTAGRMDYEGMCEVMWDSTRSVQFECWRLGTRRQPLA